MARAASASASNTSLWTTLKHLFGRCIYSTALDVVAHFPDDKFTSDVGVQDSHEDEQPQVIVGFDPEQQQQNEGPVTAHDQDDDDDDDDESSQSSSRFTSLTNMIESMSSPTETPAFTTAAESSADCDREAHYERLMNSRIPSVLATTTNSKTAAPSTFLRKTLDCPTTRGRSSTSFSSSRKVTMKMTDLSGIRNSLRHSLAGI
eukprot:TRINITY_DN3630_c0_g1_i1.p1 TRINITY_DN3630_c0_g1~~TRINITY_DN3630_c0_g1_i1.p1  ORF type:complete len:204 (+),score=57.90 TRINITY_DN3630_c0_g1_i1:19-630(+)